MHASVPQSGYVHVERLLAQGVAGQGDPVTVAQVRVVDQGREVRDEVVAEVESFEFAQGGQGGQVGYQIRAKEDVGKISGRVEAGEVRDAGVECLQAGQPAQGFPRDRVVHMDARLRHGLRDQPAEHGVGEGDGRPGDVEGEPEVEDQDTPRLEGRDVLVDRRCVQRGVEQREQGQPGIQIPDFPPHERTDVRHAGVRQVQRPKAGKPGQRGDVRQVVVRQIQQPKTGQASQWGDVRDMVVGQIQDGECGKAAERAEVGHGVVLEGQGREAEQVAQRRQVPNPVVVEAQHRELPELRHRGQVLDAKAPDPQARESARPRQGPYVLQGQPRAADVQRGQHVIRERRQVAHLGAADIDEPQVRHLAQRGQVGHRIVRDAQKRQLRQPRHERQIRDPEVDGVQKTKVRQLGQRRNVRNHVVRPANGEELQLVKSP